MKKKVLSVLITILALCTCMFTITGCGHTHKYDQQVVNDDFNATEATCTKKATYYYSCICGEKGTETFEYGNSLGHSFTYYIYNDDAECGIDGTETATCNNNCGESDTRTKEGSALEHNFTNYVYNDDAECGIDGTETATCNNNCGESDTRTKVGSALEHTFTNYEYNNDAKCGVDGTETATCDNGCSETHTRRKMGSALKHEYSAWVSNNNGTHTRTCSHDNSHKETKNCNGGTATCQAKAVCVDCNSAYGNFANCNADTEWTTTETHHYHACKTENCTEKLDKENHTFDKNKKCTVCEYVTTELMWTEISSDVFAIDGTNLYVKVPNTQSSFAFAETINVADGATYKVYTDIQCKEDSNIPSYMVNNLIVGDNTYYFLVSNEGSFPKIYTATIRRRHMYTVNFVTHGGASVQSQTIEEDSFATQPTTSRVGYTFAGWDYDFSTPITKNTTITASWNINQYTLTIKYNNEQEDLVLKQDYNTDIQTIANPEKLGYTFAGWDNTIPSKMPAEDLTINASWEINQYTLRIVYNNGETDLVLTQDYNSDIENISNPIKPGYTFAGWDNTIPSKMPAEDLTINAIWQANDDTPYRVEYYLQNLENDGYSLSAEHSFNTCGTTDKTVTLTPNTLEHFTFNENYAENVLSGNIAENGSLILKVYYTRNVYKLSVNNSFAGSITNAGSYKYGSASVVAAVTTINLGYDFVGWYSGEILLSQELTYAFPATQDVTAMFAPKQEMSQFYFESTPTVCEIWGVKNKLITEIVVPNYVTGICSYAFSNCTSLTSIEIPNSVTSIGEWAFAGCSSLTYNIKDGLKYLGNNNNKYLYLADVVDNYSITSAIIDSNCRLIGNSAFQYCYSLTSVVIPDSVTSIGREAFSSCSKLTSITIPNSVTSIRFETFYGCRSLTSIVIPDSVTSIGYGAFYNCRSLTNIVIPDSVTSIDEGAFSGCSKLTTIKYRGSSSQWSNIYKGSDWNYNTGSYTITYNYDGE